MTSIRIPDGLNPFSDDPAIEQAKEWMEETYDDYPDGIDAFRRRPHEPEYVQVVLDEPMDLYVMGALIEAEGIGGITPGEVPAANAERFEVDIIGDPGEDRSTHTMTVEEYGSGATGKHAFSHGQFYEQEITLGREDTLEDAEPRANPTYDRIRQLGRYLDLVDELDIPEPTSPAEAEDWGEEYAKDMTIDGNPIIEVGVRTFGGNGYLTQRLDREDVSEYEREDAVREAKRELRRDKVRQVKQYLEKEDVLD